MRDLYKRTLMIVVGIGMLLIFHEIVPKPCVYFADFVGGIVLGVYWS